MTTAIAILVLLALIVGASKLFQHWLDSYLKDDSFDEAQAKADVEELLKAANKAPKKRAF